MNKGKISIQLILIAVLFMGIVSLISHNTVSATQVDECGEKFNYTKNSDFDDNRVDINFSNGDETISVSAKAGYKINKVELDVEDDNHGGYYTYATGPLSNFNPNPGDDIDSAKVEVEKVCATPSPSPSPSPSPTPVPTDVCDNLEGNQEVVPEGYYESDGNCYEEKQEDPTPTPVPDVLGFWMDDPGCGNSFGVNAKYTFNGNPVNGLAVEFKYMADHSYQTTNSNGVAEAGFEYKGNDKVYAIASGYPQQELTPWLKTDCKPSENTGTVLGASTQGQVLGASTMAKTGTADQAMALVFTLGSLLTTIGLKPYASKKN